MRFRRATEVSAAVKIEEHRIAGHCAFDLFAENAAKTYGKKFLWRTELYRVGAKNPPRDAIIAHTLQTALNAPF